MNAEIYNYVDANLTKMIGTLSELVAIPSVKGKAVPGKPYGEECAKVLDKMLNIASSFGFRTENHKNRVGTIDFYPDGEPSLGILCHLDVVPAGDGWKTPPFSMFMSGGKLYGRGTMDDKGPAVCVLYAMKAIKDCGIKLSKNVRFIVGTDEENGSSDLAWYKKQAKLPPNVFTPDGSYPVINIEKGMIRGEISAKCAVGGTKSVISDTGGTVINAVPESASATVVGFSDIELTLADLEVIQNRISKIEKKAQTTKDKEALKELTLLNTINDALTNDIPVRRLKFTPEEEKMIKSFNLLTSKPIIYIANIKESDIGLENEYTKLVRDYALKDNADVIEMCAKIESEISSLDDEERTLFLNELGIKESGLDSLIKSTYSLLGLRTFFTVGTDEVRAWTFKKGMKAPECAGIIHTDFQKGFIKAEVMSYDDLIECGSETKVKESGKMRLEGKEYEMQDGDICHFRFNK